MFSGQGSQYYHMGKELYENHSRFKLWMDHCDEIVCPLIQTSLIDVLYRGQNKSVPFDQLLYTNPALLCFEYSLARILLEMNIHPDYLLGYSLGEITTSVVSGAVSLEEGIEFVVDMAKLLEKETQPAGMLAIIEAADIMTEFPDLFQNCWFIGKNFQKNFVVSGLPDDIHHLQKALNQKNITSQKLPVCNGFHTELMDPIKEKFKQLVGKINFFDTRIPIISSLNGEQVHEVSEDLFWKVTRYPVDFDKSIGSMLKKGDYIFIDAGPSGSLATFVKYILPTTSNSFPLQVINQFGRDIDSIEKLRNSLSDVTLNN